MEDVGLNMIMSKSYFGHLTRRTDSLETTLITAELKAGGEEDKRG